MQPKFTSPLKDRRCQPCEEGIPALSPDEAAELLKSLSGWELHDREISRVFSFKNYYHTLAFINAVAWIAHREDHHPEITFAYKTCTIRYATHAIGGLSENDFICAAKIQELISV